MTIHSVDETILMLIGSGQTDIKSVTVKQTGLAPPTVSAAASCLTGAEVITEAEHSVPTGGRRTRHLVTSDGAGALTLVELGIHHGLVALTGLIRGVGQALSLLTDIAERLWAALDAVMDEVSRQEEVAGVRAGGITLAVPGPVDAERSRVTRLARMPGWDGINVVEAVAEQCGLPALIENDTRTGIIDESVYRRRLQGVTPIDTLTYVKVDPVVDDACLIDGVPQMEQGGLVGDIPHIPVKAAAGRPCKYDNVGCLETIVSADPTRANLAAAGLIHESDAQLLAAAHDGIPEATTATRQTGTLLGHCVARLVSFLAPQGVVVGGALFAIDAFTTGVCVTLHQSCLPSIMEHLVIKPSRSGREAAFWGPSTLTPSKISKENRS